MPRLVRSRPVILTLVGIVLMASLLACGTAGNGNGETAPPTATEVPLATNTPSQDDYIKWAPPVGYIAILGGVCEAMLTSQENLASGEITGIEAFGQAFLAAGMLGSLQEDLPGWVPGEGQQVIKERLLQHIEVMKPVLDSWLSQQTTTDDALAQFALECPAVQETYDLLLEEAAKDGFNAADMEAMLEEMIAAGDAQPGGE